MLWRHTYMMYIHTSNIRHTYVKAFCKRGHTGRDPFNQPGGPVFSKLFRLDRTDPLSFGPKFPEILVEWIAPTLSGELFIRSVHSHYSRFFAAGNFHVQRSRLNQLLLAFSRTGARIWNKIPLKLHEQSKAPFKRKLHKLLLQVLETEEVYVDVSTITRSYHNSLFGLSFLSFFYSFSFLSF